MAKAYWHQKTSGGQWFKELYSFWRYEHKKTRRRKSRKLNDKEAEGLLDLSTYHRDIYDIIKQQEKPLVEQALLVALLDLVDAVSAGQMTQKDAFAKARDLFYDATVELLWETPKQEVK